MDLHTTAADAANFALSEDQVAFRAAAATFAAAELAPQAAHWDAEGIFPREAIAKANFTVAVDAVNSVGGIVIPQLLRALGVKNIIELTQSYL